MHRILFVCHGNICRSPMAEFIMKDIVSRNGADDEFIIGSCATSSEEIGNDIYPPAKRVLDIHGVPYTGRKARRMTPDDYISNDMIICMDRQNLRNLRPFVGDDPDGKVSMLLQHSGLDKDVDDPWYTGDFERTFREISGACEAIFRSLNK